MDYFNLETSSEEDEQPTSNKSNDKWDWDKPENFKLYYSYTNHKRKLEEDTETNPIKRTNDLRIEKVDSQSVTYTLHGHKSDVNRVNWAKKYSNKDLLISCSYNSNIILWNLRSLTPKKFDVHTKFVRNVIFSNEEASFISVSYDQTSCVTDLETGQIRNKYTHDNILTSVSSHPKNEDLIILGSKNELLLWDLKSSKITKKYKTKSYIGVIQDVLFLNDTQFVSTGDVISKDSAEYAVMVWDLDTTAVLSNQIFHEKFICTNLRKHPFNSLFYAQTHGDYIAEFSSRTPFKMNRYRRFESHGHSTKGYSIGFDLNSNGSLIASGSIDSSVYVYNTSSSNLVKKINKETFAPKSLDVKFKTNEHGSNENETIAVAYSNGLIKIYKL